MYVSNSFPSRDQQIQTGLSTSGASCGFSTVCLMREGAFFELTAKMKLFQNLSELFNSGTNLHCDLGQVTEGQVFRSSVSTTRARSKCINHPNCQISIVWRHPSKLLFWVLAWKHHKGDAYLRVSGNPCAGKGPKPFKAPLYHLNAPRGFISPFQN